MHRPCTCLCTPILHIYRACPKITPPRPLTALSSSRYGFPPPRARHGSPRPQGLPRERCHPPHRRRPGLVSTWVPKSAFHSAPALSLPALPHPRVSAGLRAQTQRLDDQIGLFDIVRALRSLRERLAAAWRPARQGASSAPSRRTPDRPAKPLGAVTSQTNSPRLLPRRSATSRCCPACWRGRGDTGI